MPLRRRRVLAWKPLDDVNLLPGDIPSAPVPFEDQIAEAKVLRSALLTIGPQDAASFLLQAALAFSTAEIAAILEIAPDALRKAPLARQAAACGLYRPAA